MPKLKTHKGTAKVVTKRKNDIKIGHPGTRHNTGKNSAKRSRQKRKGNELHNSDLKRVKDLI